MKSVRKYEEPTRRASLAILCTRVSGPYNYPSGVAKAMKGEVKADVTAKERSKVAGCPGLSVRGVHPDALGPLQVQNTDKTALGFRSRHPQGQLNQNEGMAERVGFEPTVGVSLHTLSKRAP